MLLCRLFSFKSFDSLGWKLYKAVRRKNWRPGEFINTPTIEAIGGREYVFRFNPHAPFAFKRYSGEVIVPHTMVTDGGSIPSCIWSLGLDPWIYMGAYLIHDWEYMAHHANPNYAKTFEDVNDTLAEAILTLMVNKMAPENWWNLTAAYTGVSSLFGRTVWNRTWTKDALDKAFPLEE